MRSRKIPYGFVAAVFFVSYGGAYGQAAGPEAGPPPQLQLKKAAAPGAETKVYRVQPGDHVYKIRRREFETGGKEEIVRPFNRLRQLNPEKKSWDRLLAGETFLLPERRAGAAPRAAPPGAAKATAPARFAERLRAEDAVPLIHQAVSAAGIESHFEGEEIVTLPEGSLFLDRRLFPIFSNPSVNRRVIFDPGRQLPAFLSAELENRKEGLTAFSIKKGMSLREAVEQLLARLGYEILPADRLVTVQNGGAALSIRGDWMVMSPIEAGQGGNVWIINLGDETMMLSDDVKACLSLKGISLSEFAARAAPVAQRLPVSTLAGGGIEPRPRGAIFSGGNAELLNALLRQLAIPFQSSRELSIGLGQGMRVEIRVDRYFEVKGTQFGLLFASSEAGFDKLTGGLRLVEIDVHRLSSRELVSRLLGVVGEPVPYREHTFLFGRGRGSDRLVVSTSGFFSRIARFS